MKKLVIESVIEDDKIISRIRTQGFSNKSISDQLAILGLLENFKGIIENRIKKFIDITDGKP